MKTQLTGNKSVYTVTVAVTDGEFTDTVDVNITENRPPIFPPGAIDLIIDENTAADVNIGAPIAATDPDGDTLTYSLDATASGADLFAIDSVTGQLKTVAPLDYETESGYLIGVVATDPDGLIDKAPLNISIKNLNEAPTFTDGASTTRKVSEDAVTDEAIGLPISATDPDVTDTNTDTNPETGNSDTLTYSLGGTNADAFSIDTSTGQLKVKSDLDYDTKSSYSVTVTVSDGASSAASTLTDAITVTINVRTVQFDEGDFTTRSIAENSAGGTNIGAPVTATDTEGRQVLYDFSSPTNVKQDNYLFALAVDSDGFNTGQIRTGETLALNFERKHTYTVRLSASVYDEDMRKWLIDIIMVTVNVLNVNEAPSFPEGPIARNVSKYAAVGTEIGEPVVAIDPDITDTNDDANPDTNALDTLTYSLSGTDVSSFAIDGATGQLRTDATLDQNPKTTYTVTVTASDGALTASVDVDISAENAAPTFPDAPINYTLAENTPGGTAIGVPVTATDLDSGDTLTYSLSGRLAPLFDIDTETGQLLTRIPLNYETIFSGVLPVEVIATDRGGLTDEITVFIEVTNLNETPSFPDGPFFRAVSEDTGTNMNIGDPIVATDPDVTPVNADTNPDLSGTNPLRYWLAGADAGAFAIDGATGQLKTNAALDHATQSSYTLTVTVSDGTLSDATTVTINVIESRTLVFVDTGLRFIAENTSGDIGDPLTVAYSGSGTVSYSLSGADAASFTISSTGQLQTSAALDYETQSAYMVTVTASDGSDSDTIDLTLNVLNVNEMPVFLSDVVTSLSIPENAETGTDIGDALTATDPDVTDTNMDTNPETPAADLLTYFLSSTDQESTEHEAFAIDQDSGQLRTKAILDRETKDTYMVAVAAYDGSQFSLPISVTITVTDANEPPSFTEGDSTTRSVRENTASGIDIGMPVTATDPNSGDTLTYSLSGTDADSFSIDTSNGQLQTSAALDYETETSYQVTVEVSDGYDSDSIAVTINVIDVTSVIRDRTRQVREAIVAAAGVDSEDEVTEAHLEAITSLSLSAKNITDLEVGDFNGLSAMTTLDVSNNALRQLSPGLFDDLTALTTLNVSNNLLNFLLADVFDGLTALTTLNLSSNYIPFNLLPASVFDDLTSLTTLNLSNNVLSSLLAGLFDNPTALTTLNLSNNRLSSLPDGIFSALSALTTLNLSDNALSALPDGIFSGLTALTTLNLANNTGTPFSVSVALEKVAAGEFKAVAPTGAPFDIALPVSATNGSIDGGVTTHTIPKGSVESGSLTVTRTPSSIAAVTTDIGTLPALPAAHSGYALVKSGVLPLEVFSRFNTAPTFTEGASTTRTIRETQKADVKIGAPVSATDSEGDPLTYSIRSVDGSEEFGIDSSTGQLKTWDVLDYEFRKKYTVTVEVSDEIGATNTITVTINITDDASDDSDADRPGPVLIIKQNGATVESIVVAADAAIFDVIIDFDEPVTGFTQSDLKLTVYKTNATITEWIADPDGQRYTARMRATEKGYITFWVNANVAEDAEGYGNLPHPKRSIAVFLDEGPITDTDQPRVSIEAPSETQTGPFFVTAVFTEPVFEFTESDMTVTWTPAGGYNPDNPDALPEGAVVSITDWFAEPGDMRYRAIITPMMLPENSPLHSAFTVYVTVPEDVAQDAAGNLNTGSLAQRIAVTLLTEPDTTPPRVVSVEMPEDPATTFDAIITWSEPVIDFTPEDTVKYVPIVSVQNVVAHPGGTRYTLTLAPIRGGGNQLQIDPGMARDAAGNWNTEGQYFEINTWFISRPTVEIISPEGVRRTSDPFEMDTFEVTVEFSAEVTGFEQSELTFTGTADAAITSWTPQTGGTDYLATITSANGVLILNVPEGVAVVESHLPWIFVDAPNYAAKPVKLIIWPEDVTHDGNIDIFDEFEVAVNFGRTITGEPDPNPDVNRDGVVNLDDYELVKAYIISGAEPSATAQAQVALQPRITELNNLQAEFLSVANSLKARLTPEAPEPEPPEDTDPPGVSLAVPSGVQNSAFDATITFTEAVSDFVQADVDISGTATASITAWQTTDNITYTATITPAISGTVTLGVAANVATDAANNPNTAATPQIVTVDVDRPTATIGVPSGTQTGAFDATITFSETVSGFAQSDVSLSGSAASITDWRVNTANTLYTATITPTADGTVTLNVAANVATDTAGNTNTAATAQTVSIERPPVIPDPATWMPDANLRNAIRSALGLATGAAFTQADLQQLTELWASRSGISDLTGLEHATELIKLSLWANDISNLTPIQGLTKLTYLRLARNDITDVSPLSGLTTLTSLGVQQNSIADVSALASLVNLTWIRLVDNPVTDFSALVTLVNVTDSDVDLPDPDTTEPGVSITVPSGVQKGAFNVTITFTESVSGFAQSDVSLSGSAANITDWRANSSDTVYTATITPTTSGTVTISVAANVATDAAGNPNTAATSQTVTIEIPPAIPDPATWMPDANLRKAVQASLGLTDGETLTQAKMADLTELKAAGRSISDITGIEHATNLSIARLANNQISSLSPLSGLTALTTLRLQGNQISDVSPLLALTGLTELFLNNNQITDVTPLRGLVNLERLRLSENPFANSGANAETLDALRSAGVDIDIPVADDGGIFVPGAPTGHPVKTQLLANYPNPFNPETWIPYHLAKDANVQITIYDMRGVVVRRLDLGHQQAGYYTSRSRAAHWDGTNEVGEHVAAGIYLYHLRADDVSLLRKMVVLK